MKLKLLEGHFFGGRIFVWLHAPNQPNQPPQQRRPKIIESHWQRINPPSQQKNIPPPLPTEWEP